MYMCITSAIWNGKKGHMGVYRCCHRLFDVEISKRDAAHAAKAAPYAAKAAPNCPNLKSAKKKIVK